MFWRKWLTFCVINSIPQENPSLSHVSDFLVELFNKGASYSAINSARCALSNALPYVDGIPVGKNPIICRILKGMYNNRPQRTRYCSTWDVDIVLHYLRELSPLISLSLRQLTNKFVVLLMLITCQRVQTLASLKLEDLLWSKDKKVAVFRLSQVLKHSKRGSLGVITLRSFDDEPRLCVLRSLRAYLEKTSELRKGSNQHLFITTTPPYGNASSITIARWIKQTINTAGIDTSLFKAHSVRGASTSKLAALHIPVHEIMKKASWKSESTFRKFYEKPLLPKDVSHKVLSAFLRGDK